VLLGGADPVDALERWRSRINHVHVKDARLSVLDEVNREGAGKQAVWDRGAWCELGAGDLETDAFLDALHGHGYHGWLVVEQDRIPAPGEDLSIAAAAQVRNRTYLEKRGF
jgi:inosose dehydratase